MPRRFPRFWRALLVAAAVIVGVAIIAYVASREVRYVARAAVEEARILLARRPLDELVRDSTIPAARRTQFALVLAARDFAGRELGLATGDTYTTFTDVGRDTLVLLLTASPRDRLVAHTWWYPIVGAVPYKGFFDPDAARAEAHRLAARGFDTYLRPAVAFSTLGWFNDPLLSTAMSDDPVQLVATVIHEITHNTLYVAGEVRFNESFASFVGYRGAERFFASRGETARADRAAAMWRDEWRLGAFYGDLGRRLEGVYGASPSSERLERERAALFAVARRRLATELAGEFEVYDGERLAQREVNNASLIAWTLYRWRLDRFEQVLAQVGGDVARAVGTIVETVRSRPEEMDPYEALPYREE